MTANENLDLVLERVIDAPRDLVWKVWTNPEHLKKWWAPKPVITTECKMDLRPGGLFRTVMKMPDGALIDGDGCFLEIVPEERIVFTDALLPGWRPSPEPFFTAIITMQDEGNGTRYTARAIHGNDADRKKHEEMGFHTGWGAALDQFIELLAELK